MSSEDLSKKVKKLESDGKLSNLYDGNSWIYSGLLSIFIVGIFVLGYFGFFGNTYEQIVREIIFSYVFLSFFHFLASIIYLFFVSYTVLSLILFIIGIFYVLGDSDIKTLKALKDMTTSQNKLAVIKAELIREIDTEKDAKSVDEVNSIKNVNDLRNYRLKYYLYNYQIAFFIWILTILVFFILWI